MVKGSDVNTWLGYFCFWVNVRTSKIQIESAEGTEGGTKDGYRRTFDPIKKISFLIRGLGTSFFERNARKLRSLSTLVLLLALQLKNIFSKSEKKTCTILSENSSIFSFFRWFFVVFCVFLFLIFFSLTSSPTFVSFCYTPTLSVIERNRLRLLPHFPKFYA